ncbi:alpha/beta hydrolase [Streptomyces sp. ITFR-6]|uniref:alpha/beta hydrolase n=1 Tax=Streptomyces sp. ITFR-6 TaxID=3075197 RepID=UPI002889489D|nr:alpha/beta hydrolase [Streptomyces sp. ITFR-6]WNI27416.1 alpha/beta hydrolase [Streptomyces sp. ITFR-6]
MPVRLRNSRLRRTLLAALIAASVAAPVSGASSPAAVPAPVPAPLAPLRDAARGTLDARYAVTRDGILAAGRMAARHGDRKRASALRGMADPRRHFLLFDGRDGGRTAEVFGDLTRAERIAVLVPGADTNLDRYWRLKNDSAALRRELGPKAAVVAWLGYETPATVSPAALTTGRADTAAPALGRFTDELHTARPAARISLLCHSYGSVVCARAAPVLRGVAALVLYASPGTGARDVSALHTRATVWAGRGTTDWVADVPHTRLRLPFVSIGFGPDPVSPGFGARTFDAGTGGRSDYLKPGSRSLKNIARIVSGTAPSGRSRHA